MVHKLIQWAVHNRLVVVLLAIAIAAVGVHAFLHINIEAYPDPAPAIVEVITQYPGASAEEVERQITVPMEVALSGMPGLDYTRSKSLFGLSHVRNQFDYGIDFNRAKTEVLNRLNLVDFPEGVTPAIAPTSPIGEIYRFVLSNPKDLHGNGVYNLADLKTLLDWTLERDFRRLPRIADVVSFGGEEKRYEIQPDPERLKQYGISLDQLETAVRDSNGNAGGDYLMQGETAQAVRGLGLIGGGQDPTLPVLNWKDPERARDYLRAEDDRRTQAIRQIVLSSTNNVPVRVGEVVDGGRLEYGASSNSKGVIVGHHTRMGWVSVSRPRKDAQGEFRLNARGERTWSLDDDVVEGVVLLRKGEHSLPALAAVKDKVKELNEQPGRMLPGVKVSVFNDRTELINRTTHTVRENLFVGLTLVTLILLVFLGDWRSTLIVAINIPLSLLCSFAVLYLRGQSANLLSLGAVDFGIIADSSIIIVECIYRFISSGERPDLPLVDRIVMASAQVERILFFSTLIMIFALLPLFTMQGPEGQIFGPMADTYAIALGSALFFSVTLCPVFCRVLFGQLRPAKENRLVRWLNGIYLRQLDKLLKFRWISLGGFIAMIVATVLALPFLGREFMPALEEGNLYLRGTFPVNVSLKEVHAKSAVARKILESYPELQAVLVQVGRPDDGTDPTGFYNAEFFAPLRPQDDWPKLRPQQGWRRFFSRRRHRTKNEIIEEMDSRLSRVIPGVNWSFSQAIRDNVMETLSGVKGENSVKIIGPDLARLQVLADQTKNILRTVPGIQNVGVFSIKGQTNLEFLIDGDKCARWNVKVADVQNVVQTAIGGKAFTEIVEGEKSFDLTLRFPERLRTSVDQILDIPVDVVRNQVTSDSANRAGVSTLGYSQPAPSLTGSEISPGARIDQVPRRRLKDLVTPVDDRGLPSPEGKYVRSGASTIYREQGKRMIAVSFSVRGRDLASAVAEAQAKTSKLFQLPYQTEWSGEFEEMQAAGRRLAVVVSLALVLILVLLYLALHSLLDALVVLSNVLVMCIGGVWSLILTGETFNISAGVGFISILGVGTMNALLFISRFNQLRAEGMPLRDSIFLGVEKLIRPQAMTALTAILGLLPAALSTQIGSETQRPLAIVVVGGMLTTLLLTNLMGVLYSFYGHREPPEGSGAMAH